MEIPKSAPKATRFALETYERQWIERSEHRAKTAAMIMLYTGIRRGELLALMVGDINLTKRTLRVDKAIYYDGNTPCLKRGGKTDAATRTLPIPDVLARYLRSVLAGRSPMEILVCDDHGKHLTESAFTRMWESFLSYLNEQHGQTPGEHKSRFTPGGIPMMIRNITPHTLRHTYATMLHAAGVDVLTAQRFLGHADVKTTLSIYTHLEDGTVQSDTKKLDEYLETVNA